MQQNMIKNEYEYNFNFSSHNFIQIVCIVLHQQFIKEIDQN